MHSVSCHRYHSDQWFNFSKVRAIYSVVFFWTEPSTVWPTLSWRSKVGQKVQQWGELSSYQRRGTEATSMAPICTELLTNYQNSPEQLPATKLKCWLSNLSSTEEANNQRTFQTYIVCTLSSRRLWAVRQTRWGTKWHFNLHTLRYGPCVFGRVGATCEARAAGIGLPLAVT